MGGRNLISYYTRKMLEHYEKAAKALDLDIDKIMLYLVRPIIQEEQTRQKKENECNRGAFFFQANR